MQSKKEYFEEIYETYVKQIFRFVYLRVNNAQLAEDFTAETFLRFWKTIENGKTIENERALLYVIARGIIIDFYRSKKHTNEIALTAVEETILAENNVDELFEKIDTDQKLIKIYGIIKKLKKEYQEIIILRFIEDLEYAEIAIILGKKENNIRVLLHRAIAMVKEIV